MVREPECAGLRRGAFSRAIRVMGLHITRPAQACGFRGRGGHTAEQLIPLLLQ
jgi:hypothetical protein